MVNRHSLEKLEYQAFLELIADYTKSEPGRQWVTGMYPFADKSRIESRQQLLQDVLRFRSQGFPYPELCFQDIRRILKRARPLEAVLSASELRECADFLSVVTGCLRLLNDIDESDFPNLTTRRNSLAECPALQTSLTTAIDEDCNILDSATPELQRLRRQIRELEKNIHDILQAELNSPEKQNVFQERFITVRNGRHVVPVVRKRKSEVQGVVHDHSNSGQTLFMELAETLPLANRLTDARLEEEDECRRIRKQLSGEVRKQLTEISRDHDIMQQLDAAFAIADWAVEYGCVIPRFSKRLALYQARHPLLQNQLIRQGKGDSLVPLDIELDPPYHTLLVTGSNSGGKTVAVKTAGLLILGAQTGLPMPLDKRSEVPLFSEVFVDIGDEQSLAENLSTFTGHISRISGIIQTLQQQQSGYSSLPTLVILDELGTGTDPVEGAALACAVLEKLSKSADLTLATTHLSYVKNFVHNRDDMQNAGVRFNPETLQPEYKLEFGTPANSHAIEIAERTGFAPDVLQRARDFLDSDHLQTERLLSSLQQQQRALEKQKEKTARSLDQANKHRQSMEKEREDLDKERRQVLNDAYQEARRIINDTREKMDKLIKQQKKQAHVSSGAEKPDITRQIREKESEISDKIESTRSHPRKPLAPEKLQTGKEVWVESLKANAVIRTLPDKNGKLKVTLRGLEFEVKTDQIGEEYKDRRSKHGETGHSKSDTVNISSRIGGHGGRNVSSELNLTGCYTEEARRQLDQTLNAAILANLSELRVIHGFGSGKLRQAVHEFLRENPLVESYRLGEPEKDAGGGGVTIVTLTDTK